MNFNRHLKPFLKKSLLSLFFIANSCLITEVKAESSPSFCRQNLPDAINNIIAQPHLKRANWGIIVKNGNDSEVFYQLNDDKYFLPASNAKLLVTAGSLIKFNENYQIITPVYQRGRAPVLDSLIILGAGDPSFSHENLQNLAQILQADGVKSINNLVVIGDNQADNLVNGTWEVSDLPFPYAPPISKLNLAENILSFNLVSQQSNQFPIINWSDKKGGKQWNVNNQVWVKNNIEENKVKLTVNWQKNQINLTGEMLPFSESRLWRLTIPNPSQYFLDSFLEILQTKDIQVNTDQVADDNFSLLNYQLYQEIKSPDLKELIDKTNKNSNNLYSEILYNNLANNNQNKKEVLRSILVDLGLAENSFFLNDGSGLSRQNLVTPSALHRILELMKNDKIFVNSLSIAGVDGTLKNRFKKTIVEGNFLGKTGTLTGAVALSGYLKGKNYDSLIVTIIVNNSDQSVSILRENIDNIILHLAHLEDC